MSGAAASVAAVAVALIIGVSVAGARPVSGGASALAFAALATICVLGERWLRPSIAIGGAAVLGLAAIALLASVHPVADQGADAEALVLIALGGAAMALGTLAARIPRAEAALLVRAAAAASLMLLALLGVFTLRYEVDAGGAILVFGVGAMAAAFYFGLSTWRRADELALDALGSRLAAAALVALGLLASIGWIVGSEVLVWHAATGLAIALPSAIAVTLAGIALWSAPSARIGAVLMTLAPVVLLCVVSLGGLGGPAPGAAPAFGPLAGMCMAPSTAVAMLLVCTALVLQVGGRHRLAAQGAVWVLGLLVIAIASTVLLGHVLDQPRLRSIGTHQPMALPTSLALLILGAGVLLQQTGQVLSSSRLRTVWMPSVTGLTVLGLSLTLWISLEREQHALERRDNTEAATAVARSLRDGLEARLDALSRIGERLVRFDGLQRERMFDVDAELNLGGLAGAVFFAWLDADGAVRRYREARGAGASVVLDPAVAMAMAGTIEAAAATHEPCMSAPLALADDQPGFVVILPIVERDVLAGFLAVGADYERFLGPIAATSAPSYMLQVRDADVAILRRGTVADVERPDSGTATVAVFGRDWAVRAVAASGTQAYFANRLPTAVLFAGIVVGLLLGILMHVGAVARQRAVASERSADALRRSESSLARAQRIAGLGSWEVPIGDPENLDANPLLWSNQTYRLFGYEPGEVEASNELFFAHVHPDDREAIHAAVREAMANRTVYRIDHRIVLTDGSVRHVHEEGDFIRDASGRPLRLIGTVHDITERKLAELALEDGKRQLAKSLARLRLLLDCSRDLVVVSSRGGRIIEVNAAARRLLGYEPAEMTGRPYVEFIIPEDVPATVAAANAVVATGSAVNVVNRYRHRDGHDVPLMWSAAWSAEEGVAIGIGRDITQQRNREALVLGQNRILEGMARGATLGDTLQAICALLAGQLATSRVSIVRRAGDRIEVVASSGLAQALLDAHKLVRIGEAGGSCGTAIERNRMVVSEDIEHDPLWLPFRHIAAEHGLRACWSAPVQAADGSALGSVAAYFDARRAPTDEERNLCAIGANMAGMAFERDAATRALAEMGRRYRLLFERSPMPMWLLDSETLRFVEVNDAAIDHYGWTREQFLTMSVLDIRPPDERDRYLHAHRGTVPGFQHAGLWRHLRRDGSVIDVDITYYDLTLEGRELRLMLSKDVTQQLRAQERVREQELQLRQILSDLVDAVLVVDGERRVRFGNAAVASLFGVSAEAMVGDERTVDPQLLEGGEQVLAAAHGERTVEIAVADTVWEGETARLLTLRDVTERVESDERLRRNEQQLASAMRVARMASFERDLLTDRWSWSRETGDLVGEAPEALAERPERFIQLIHHEDRAGVAEQLLAMLHGDLGAIDREARAVTADGRNLMLRLIARLERAEDGRPRRIAGTVQDVTERRHTEAQLAHLATHDPVTDLPRLLLIEEQAGSMFEQSSRRDERVVLYYVDLDRFHNINETLGHATGDRVLRAIAGRLRESFGDLGRVARVAGDQFAALVRTARGADAFERAEQVRERIEAPIRVGGYTVHVTCSIGFAEYPANGDSFGELLQRAEAAATRAKRLGRNAVVAFANEQTDELRDRLALGSRLREAVRRDELLLHYQPQVSARNGQIVGLESLVRWQSPDLGLVPPGRFIRVAEELGLIVDIGQWVLRAACRQAKAWLGGVAEGFGVAINVSALQLQRPTFVDDVRRVLEETGLPAATLEIELTESAIMENVDRMVETMRALKTLGVKLALDDFGIGYSSLNYLKRLPIDKLKVDQSFVRDIVTESSDAAIARAVIAMGHQLGMIVMAEGVETEAQVGYLRRNHCDLFQGHFFGAAVAPEEAEALLRQRFLAPEFFSGAPADRTLLLVDDEENVLRALTRTLRRDGYRIFAVSSPREAFDILGRNDVQVIVSDQRMPETDGTEFLSRVKEMYPDTVRMVLSGYTDLETVTDAINRGAIYKFLTKPWDDDDLRSQIQGAFRTWAERAGSGAPPG
jgi:diguanylate cyclase (GGDEF)-like protein/PAS domain S-box-containing protein